MASTFIPELSPQDPHYILGWEGGSEGSRRALCSRCAGRCPPLRFSVAQTYGQASPYSMDARDPQKFFMSGFTGHVPRAPLLFGSSFPVLTNQALEASAQMPSRGRGQKDPKHVTLLPRTYPQNLCLLPHYGGYVPGYKFQFGHTYGHLTHDALGLSTLQKQVLA